MRKEDREEKSRNTTGKRKIEDHKNSSKKQQDVKRKLRLKDEKSEGVMKDHISISSSLRSSVSSDDLSREPEKQVGFSPTLKVPKVPMKREDNKAKLIQDRRKSKAFFIPDDSHDTFIFSDNTIAVHDIKNLNVNKD